MSELYRINKSTLDDIGAALKEVKNVDTSVRVADIGDDIRGLKGTASADKVFAGEEFVGVNGKEVGAFTIDSELSRQDAALDELEGMVDACLGGEPIIKKNKLAKLIERTSTELVAEDFEGLTTIGRYAFYDYAGLTSIELPDNITTLADYAIADCADLLSVTFNDNLTNMGSNLLIRCKKITSVNIPKSMTVVPYYFCYQCYALTEIIMHEGITKILNNAFASCSALQNLTLPESVERIESVFRGCSGLKNLTIGSKVTYIGSSFTSANSMEVIQIKAKTPPPIQYDTFSGIPTTCVIKVPAESLEKYKAYTNWSKYADQMVASTDF